ncbi:MAG: hypothetical protein JWR07_1311 [Nevskia sp.]|nr:hypothetical protein [Nevskia sp.]
MKHLKSKLAVLALAVSGFAAQAQESGFESQVNAAAGNAPVVAGQSVAGVVVTGYSDPLLRSDQRVAMLQASLPLGATNTAVEPTSLQRLVAVFPRNPNAAEGDARRMMERGHMPPSGSDPDGGFAVGTR